MKVRFNLRFRVYDLCPGLLHLQLCRTINHLTYLNVNQGKQAMIFFRGGGKLDNFSGLDFSDTWSNFLSYIFVSFFLSTVMQNNLRKEEERVWK